MLNHYPCLTLHWSYIASCFHIRCPIIWSYFFAGVAELHPFHGAGEPPPNHTRVVALHEARQQEAAQGLPRRGGTAHGPVPHR